MDLSELLQKQRKFFASGATQGTDYRLGALGLLGDVLALHEKRLLEALWEDLRKDPVESYMTEVGMVREEIRFLSRHLGRWTKPRRVSVPISLFPGRGRVDPQPYGSVLVMAPWNYPVQLSLAPLAGALAAGNCVVLKPSEEAPATAQVLEEILGEVFDPEYVAVVQGDKEVGQALLEQRFDYIFYTGGPVVGRIVMEAAAKNLTPVTLELGGKSPCIVDGTADIPMAARRITFGKFLNAGQTCVAPDYLLVEEGVKDALVKGIEESIREFFGPDPLQSPEYPAIVNRRHFLRLMGLLEGQPVIQGGNAREERWIAPTLVDCPDPASPVMQEEIFGPILPILTFRELEEAVAFVNAREKPLALYLFTRDRAAREKVLRETSSGGACVNDTVVHLTAPRLPFGGVGHSGMGAYHGKASFDTFTHYRSVCLRGGGPEPAVRYHPYSPKKLEMLRRLMK